MSNNYKPGTWNVICDVCGVECKSDEVRKRWDGLLVCRNDYEERHSMDFIRAPKPETPVPFTRPEPTDKFVFVCFLHNSQGIVGLATADCARADIKLNLEL